jgi:hypothetical protein
MSSLMLILIPADLLMLILKKIIEPFVNSDFYLNELITHGSIYNNSNTCFTSIKCMSI